MPRFMRYGRDQNEEAYHFRHHLAIQVINEKINDLNLKHGAIIHVSMQLNARR